MVDENTDFFKYVDNFAKTAHAVSIPILEAKVGEKMKITIAIPTYKRAELLREAIDSALNQIYDDNYEVLVVDNNPERDDETEKLVCSYSNCNVSYYKNAENLGMAGNWNRCVTLARGEFVILLHDDDMLYPYFLSVCSFYLNVFDIGILKPRNSLEYAPVREFETRNWPIKQVLYTDFYFAHVVGVPSGIIYKKEYFITVGGFNSDYYPSLDYCFHAFFAKVYPVYTLDVVLSFYRVECNISMNSNTKRGWLVTDSYLIRQILKEQKMPCSIIETFLSRRTSKVQQWIMQHWGSFDFCLSEIGLNETSVVSGVLSHMVVYANICGRRVENYIKRKLYACKRS